MEPDALLPGHRRRVPELSVEADAIRELVYAPENQGELELVIDPLEADACN